MGIALQVSEIGEHEYDLNIYLSDRNNDRVLKITPDEIVELGNDIEFNKPTGIALDGEGRIYVTDTNNDRLIILNTDSSLVKEIKHGFNKPTGIYVINIIDNEGKVTDKEIYITDRNNDRLVKLNANGEITMTIGGSQPVQLNKLMGVYVNEQGYIYLTDTNNDRVLKFDEYGNLMMTLGKDGDFNKPIGIVLNNSSSILYVVDRNNDSIKIFGEVK